MAYEIIATLGPASSSREIWNKMLDSGVTGFRINTSHLSVDALLSQLDSLLSVGETQNAIPYIVLDLQGSKWRLGSFDPFVLVENSLVTLMFTDVTSQASVLPVPHQDFFTAAAESDGEIVLNDAKAKLMIDTRNKDKITARVITGGEISSHKGITLRNTKFRTEHPKEKDLHIYEQTKQNSTIRYAISYIKDDFEMAQYRSWFGQEHHLIAKLERPEALEYIPEIEHYCDELWVCRGDLGAEVGLRKMAAAVQVISSSLANFKNPVLMAGQVLEHMTYFDTPTRSEICHLADLLAGGYKGVVLSDETAIGRNPVLACEMAAMFM